MSTNTVAKRAMKCYTGPTCSWHSPTGQKAVKKQLEKATEAVNKAGTPDESLKAFEALSKASEAWDATPEGYAALEQSIKDTKDPLTHAHLDQRRRAAASTIERVNKEHAQQNVPPPSLEDFMKQPHTYEVGEWKVEDEGTMYPSSIGPKSGQFIGWTPTKMIASAVRSDFKEAQEAGYLPSNLTYSVRVDNSGSGALRISIKGLTDDQIKHSSSHELKSRVERIAKAYNISRTNSQIDYFDERYYAFVTCESEGDAQYRQEEAAIAKYKREHREERKTLTGSLMKKHNGDISEFIEDSSARWESTQHGQFSYAVVPGTSLVAIDDSDSSAGYYNKTLYDLDTHRMNYSDEASFKNMLSGLSLRELRWMKKTHIHSN